MNRNKLQTMHTIYIILGGIKYLVLYVLFHTLPTIQKRSKHFGSLITWYSEYIIKWKIEDFIAHLTTYASCVGYFDRAYYGFKIWQLWKSVNMLAVDMHVTSLVDAIFVWGRINGDALLGESGKLFLVMEHETWLVWVGNGGFIILLSRNVINNRGVGG